MSNFAGGGNEVLAFYFASIESQEQKEKFEYVYTNHTELMYKTAYSIVKDPDLAEDAVHETFLQIINEIDTLRVENENELKAYLYIITRERTIDFLRKWERRKGTTQSTGSDPPLEDIWQPEQIALGNIQLETALHCLRNMSEMYRRPLMLQVEGYSVKEIAQIVNCSEANVKTRIHRARQMILHFFKDA